MEESWGTIFMRKGMGIEAADARERSVRVLRSIAEKDNLAILNLYSSGCESVIPCLWLRSILGRGSGAVNVQVEVESQLSTRRYF